MQYLKIEDVKRFTGGDIFYAKALCNNSLEKPPASPKRFMYFENDEEEEPVLLINCSYHFDDSNSYATDEDK